MTEEREVSRLVAQIDPPRVQTSIGRSHPLLQNMLFSTPRDQRQAIESIGCTGCACSRNEASHLNRDGLRKLDSCSLITSGEGDHRTEAELQFDSVQSAALERKEA